MKDSRLARSLFLGAAALAAPAHAFAQDSQQDGEFSVQRFEPAPGPRNFLSVEGARTDGELTWSAGLFFDYARDPFVLRSCISDTDCSDPNAIQEEDIHVVEDMLTWNALVSFTPHPMVQLGLRLPVAFVSGDGLGKVGNDPEATTLKAAGMGDPTLEGKVRFFGEPDELVNLGAAVDVSAPVGHATAENAFIGNSSPVAVGLRAILDLKIGDGSIAANLKGIYRADGTVGTTSIGPELRWGVAASYQVVEVLRLLAEGYGATRFETQNGTNSVEIDGGLDVSPGNLGLHLTVAGGAGVVQGIGVPAGRAIFGITYVYEPSEAEPEPDEGPIATCATNPDMPGLDCPQDKVEPDGDKDGTPDSKDICPAEAGKARAPHLGCPDRDGDGVADKADTCADQAEDYDGFKDEDGCADPDNDEDGVLDDKDECFEEPEIFNGVTDGDGCPDDAPDKDKDGLGDALDRCADKAETLNGKDDADGCADGDELVTIDDRKFSLRGEIRFEGNELAGDKSQKTVDAVGAGIKNHGEFFEVAVQVTAKDGAVAQARADAILKRIVAAGVLPSHVKAVGATGDRDVVRFEVVKWHKKAN
ncbi:MAG: transporter [Myxococcales bacterium]|nr:transporter [Myxococcales bacterium]